MQPHKFGVPPPPQVWELEQVPQLVTVRGLPHKSVPVTVPQFFPRRAQKAAFVSVTHPQTFAFPPPPQVCGDVQVPQLVTLRWAPQLS